VRRRWGKYFKLDTSLNRPDWRSIKDVRELRDAQTYRALMWVFRHKASNIDIDDPHWLKSEDWRKRYEDEMRSLSLQLDTDDDSLTDRESIGSIRWRRA
jgi:hypothetical protein